MLRIFRHDLDSSAIKGYFINLEDKILYKVISTFLTEFVIVLRTLSNDFTKPIESFPEDISEYFKKTKSILTSLTLAGSELNPNSVNVYKKVLFFVKDDSIHTLSFLIEELFLLSIENKDLCNILRVLFYKYRIENKHILYFSVTDNNTVYCEAIPNDYKSTEEDL